MLGPSRIRNKTDPQSVFQAKLHAAGVLFDPCGDERVSAGWSLGRGNAVLNTYMLQVFSLTRVVMNVSQLAGPWVGGMLY